MPVTTPTPIEFETLYTTYNACGEKKLPTIMEPTIGVTTEWTEFVVMAKVLAALDIAAKLYPHPTNIVCMSGPKSLIADANIKKGAITLVPTTRKMKVAAHGVTIGFLCRVDGFVIELNRAADAEMVVPAWFCNSSIEKKEVNLKLSTLTVVVDTAADTADGDKHYNSKSIIDIQILVNTRVLKVGDELVYYQAATKESTASHKRPFDMI